MNEENNSAVLSDQGNVLAAEDLAAALDPVAETVIAEVVEVDRPFLTTSFEEYTVSEGLLLVIALLMVGKICIDLLRRGFYWL